MQPVSPLSKFSKRSKINMQILHTVPEIVAFRKAAQAAGKTIGLVPTMGALHEGHITLMRAAKAACDVVIASRSEEHTSELQSPDHLVCRLLLEKRKKIY